MGGGAGEKTEKATPKKRRDTRKKGQVLKSQEVNTTFCTAVMFGLLFVIWPNFVQQLTGIFNEFFGPGLIIRAGGTLNNNEIVEILQHMILTLVGVMFPIVITALLAGVAINLIQVRFLFTTEPLKIKLNKLNPAKGLKELVSPKKLVELAKNILKIVVVGLVAYTEYVNLLEKFPTYIGQDIYISFIDIMRTSFMIALRMCIAMVFISVADFLYQRWKYEKDIKMSKQEVKDEFKMMEGDPKIKGKIRQKQLQMSAMRMMSQVPEADVVITNPTHYAIALRYNTPTDKAPVVIAKGQDYIAAKIREAAEEHGIAIVENPPLAQTLYATCEIDDEIPEDLYQAVADILVFVFKQKGKLPA